ncbi:uncharacterized protein OCT59_000168 [Rhizophagus irregularis]|uniref:uncharacterized protein n=1 Tax=Rhizophagus irregularis TaxID=588596 RepID=UPI003328BC95|nr:hypothetical protein OCT59_000168 [Rhizophagus irregularis]
MACSKIFSGDLPELTNEIIQHLRKDFSTLYSCILVNRLWCRLAIPLLWEDPFCIPTQNYSYIEIYLSYLKEDDKEKFNEYGIINNLLPSNTLLFNYPSLIKYLKTTRICFSVETSISSIVFDFHITNDNNRSLIEKCLLQIIISQHNLKRISFGNDCDELLSSIVLRNLGQVLPTKLEYLSLTLSFNISDFEIFLRNFQNTFIKKLLIRNMAKDDDKIILSYIKEYIMKKKRVKYLAFSEYCSNDYTNRELFFSDDEVSEFKLHNVIVQKSSVLCISDINDII